MRNAEIYFLHDFYYINCTKIIIVQWLECFYCNGARQSQDLFSNFYRISSFFYSVSVSPKSRKETLILAGARWY